MQKLSEIIYPLMEIKEKLRLDEDKRKIDAIIETIKRLANTISIQQKRIADCEQKLWECDVARKQLTAMGYEAGSDIIKDGSIKPKYNSHYLTLIMKDGLEAVKILYYNKGKWYTEDSTMEVDKDTTILKWMDIPNMFTNEI